MDSVTIGDSEGDLERALGAILPNYLPQIEGYPIEVAIFENGRNKRRDASRDSWRPGSGEIRIKFGGAFHRLQAEALSRADQQGPSPDVLEHNDSSGSRSADDHGDVLGDVLIVLLDTAEHRPGFDFVSLKWFRDSCLPAEESDWAGSESARDQILRAAIRDGIVLTSRVPNPKSPAFPVTAIRLNRQHTEVQRVLGEHPSDTLVFQPVNIRGEGLSQTVLGNRR